MTIRRLLGVAIVQLLLSGAAKAQTIRGLVVDVAAGPSQTPLKYSRMNSNCGVLVIWTRRNP